MRWYAYENVCVNGEDNIRHHANDTVSFNQNLSILGLETVTQPYLSSPFHSKRFLKPANTSGKYMVSRCYLGAGAQMHISLFTLCSATESCMLSSMIPKA